MLRTSLYATHSACRSYVVHKLDCDLVHNHFNITAAKKSSAATKKYYTSPRYLPFVQIRTAIFVQDDSGKSPLCPALRASPSSLRASHSALRIHPLRLAPRAASRLPAYSSIAHSSEKSLTCANGDGTPCRDGGIIKSYIKDNLSPHSAFLTPHSSFRIMPSALRLG